MERKWWTTIGGLVAAVLVVAGLFIVAFMIMAAIAVRSFGSSK
jgi:hypothetical protein